MCPSSPACERSRYASLGRLVQSPVDRAVVRIGALGGATYSIELVFLPCDYLRRQGFDHVAGIARLAIGNFSRLDTSAFDNDGGLNVAVAASAPGRVFAILPDGRRRRGRGGRGWSFDLWL